MKRRIAEIIARNAARPTILPGCDVPDKPVVGRYRVSRQRRARRVKPERRLSLSRDSVARACEIAAKICKDNGAMVAALLKSAEIVRQSGDQNETLVILDRSRP